MFRFMANGYGTGQCHSRIMYDEYINTQSKYLFTTTSKMNSIFSGNGIFILFSLKTKAFPRVTR